MPPGKPPPRSPGGARPQFGAQTVGGVGGMQRPRSAAALLRGDGLLVRRPHEDKFLQHVENKCVKRNMDEMKRENRTVRAAMLTVDVMSDLNLHDLKVKHNSIQRARSAMALRSGSQRNGTVVEEKKPTTHLQMRKLRDELGKSVGFHCARLDAYDYVKFQRPVKEEPKPANDFMRSLLR
eukprot:TRINITY_DN18996_c0_g1_i1.p1 TRINITY_DN18996_c0_g1~~TRINITY_DN18996_c0_g1_i1.p1  ORF type:complete len:180 (+),score=46.04 TRINITY_DN18996_c0_g1_i1:97-636(+)